MTFVSAGPEFVGVDGWGGLPGGHGPAPHVLFETGGGEDKDQADAVCPNILEAYPGLSRKEDRASGMHVVFLGVQSDVCGACLDQQDLVLLKMLMSRNLASGWNVFGAKHKMFRATILRSHFQDEVGGREGERSADAAPAFLLRSFRAQGAWRPQIALRKGPMREPQ